MTSFTGTAATIGWLAVFFLILKLGGTSEKKITLYKQQKLNKYKHKHKNKCLKLKYKYKCNMELLWWAGSSRWSFHPHYFGLTDQVCTVNTSNTTTNCLQCFTMFYNVLQCFTMFYNILEYLTMFLCFKKFSMFCNVLQFWDLHLGTPLPPKKSTKLFYTELSLQIFEEGTGSLVSGGP